MRDHIKLFIPGPIEVSPATFEAMQAPMIGHRSGDFAALSAEVQPGLRKLYGTERPVFLSTSSAWGVMEGALRNLVKEKVLNCCCGAFSDKWYDVALRCGKRAEKLQVEWGQAITAEMVDAKLAKGGFDALTLVHSETSTGVLNPLAEIAALKAKYPEVMFIVDTVSSFSTVAIPFDELGIDVMLTGSQKALAMPPGLSLFAASEAAMERSLELEDRGYYFDFQEFAKNAEKDMTPSTPVISLIYALRHKLGEIHAEGMENRFARHAALNAMVAEWVGAHGFEIFAEEGYRSRGLTCVANNREIDLGAWNKLLQTEHKLTINGGYGKIKGVTFRVSNMGDETEETMTELLEAMTATLAKIS